MTTATDKPAVQKTAKGGWLLLAVVALIAVASGVAVPWVFLAKGDSKPAADKEAKKPALIPFDEVVVNLGRDRLTRYLRVKIILSVDGNHEKVIGDHVQKQKAYLKSWLIGYLADQSVEEVGGAAGVHRVRREIRDQFNALLYPDGSEKILDVLFDVFVVQ
jgi:flagellar basal body-associated protein FliL